MSDSDNNNKKVNINPSGSGIGFGGLLAILFIGLKLTGYITWSWWWVLSPLWIPMSLGLVLIIFGCIFVLVGAIGEHYNHSSRYR